MRCSKCGTNNSAANNFCAQCGNALVRLCAKCSAQNPQTSNFCGKCGAPLTNGAGAVTTAPPSHESAPGLRVVAEQLDAALATEGERKMVTALFADIKGSMELLEDLDPEEAQAIIDPALKLMIDAVQRYDGYIVQSTGDGVFALFGAPVAREDHPQRALYAALRMQEEMRRYGDRMRTQGQAPLQVRVGVNTGEVVVRLIQTGTNHTEYAPIGHSTGLAARLQTLATPGTTVISGYTRGLVEGFFQLKSLGPTKVKGVSEQVEVYEVTGLGPFRTPLQRSAVRGLTKFVGRQREMDALKHAATQAQAGRGQIVAVMAGPGVGKSRLFYEFKAIEGGAGWMVLEAFSVSHGKASAYLPVLGLLSDYFEIGRDDDERKRRERILGKVLGLDRTLEDTLPYLYSLQGITEAVDSLAQMDPQVRQRRTLEAIKRVMLRESLNQPLMVIFEDLHWIDAETQAFLNLLADAIANSRILLLMNYRPEYRDEWGGLTHYTQLRLNPLGRESAEEMLDALLTSPLAHSVAGEGKGEGVASGEDADFAALKRLIIERTEGTPFFMEEMVQALFEQGALARNGTVKLTRLLTEIKVPPTVQAVLASRIDRLPPNEKDLLQTLAVLGREFALDLAQQVTHKSGDDLERMLSQLQFGEFILEQPAAGEVEYIFKHALTQEVAYNSMLAERRRALHERTARAIEELYADQLDNHYGDLARHYLRGNDAAKAIRYAQLAAEQALSRAAYPQAMSLIETGLKLVDKLPEGAERSRTELALRSIESTVAMVLHGGSSSRRERAIRRMCELAENIGTADEFLRALSTLSGLHFTQGESARGLDLARRCLMLGHASQHEGLLLDALYNAGVLAWSCGNLREAASHFESAMREAHRTISGASPQSQTGILYASLLPGQIGLNLQQLGRVSEVVHAAQESLRYARSAGHLFSLAYALVFAGGVLALERRQADLARAYSEEGIAVSEEHGFAEWLPWGRFIHGWALAEQGRTTEGLTEMEAGIAGFERLGGVPQLQYLKAVRAECLARNGKWVEALPLLNHSLAHIKRSGERGDHAEILRLKGEVLLMGERPATAEAEKCFREALEVAHRQEAKWWELRTSVSLARLLHSTDRREEARTLLAAIYGWFTEGFDLPDLQEAKALLDELTIVRATN